MSYSSYYSKDEIRIIQEYYPNIRTSTLQKNYLPKRTIRGIRLKAFKLGVKKNPDMIDFGIDENETIIGHLTEEEKGYIAGIIDGEGCIHAAKRKRKDGKHLLILQIRISNTSKPLIDWLINKLPRGVSYNFKPSFTDKKSRRNRTVYHWSFAGTRKVKIFLKEIAPYLVIKKKQAIIASSYRNSMTEKERMFIYHRLKYLKKE